MNWYIGVLQKYATFSGRARRKEYWMFVLFNYIFTLAAMFLDNMLHLDRSFGSSYSSTGPIYTIYVLAVFVPTLAVGVRRMHDTGRSGWWLIVPIANLVFACTDGTPGANKFGEDPKGRMAGYAPQPYGQPGYAQGGPGATAPAAWIADPTGRHEYRYWDGTAWTANVSDNGVVAEDPV